MEETTKKPFLLENLGNLKCSTHKKRPLEWLCIDKECPKRLFCSFCVISEHKKVHEDFVSLRSFLEDPFSSFSYLLWNNEDNEDYLNYEEITLKEKLSSLIKKNAEKLDFICSNIVKEIYEKFDEMKLQFVQEIEKFIVTHEKDYSHLESLRQEFLGFSREYYKSIEKPQINIEQLKEGLDILCEKYYSNTELMDYFQMRINSMPQIMLKNDYKIIIENHSLNNMKWNYFADKCLATWSFNTSFLPNEFIFSNNNLTAKSKECNHGTTLVGTEIMEEGYYKWSVHVEEKQAEYINIGVIPYNLNINYHMCNYLAAYCVSSDNASYNGNKVQGNFSINKGDCVELVLDFDEDVFIIKNNKFKYEKNNIKGKRLLPYVGFSSYSASKVTLIR